MKDYQTPQKDQSRSSDLANRKSKESQFKKPQKIAKKSLNGAFSSVSEDVSSKESIDFSSISEVSDANHNGDTADISSSTFTPSDLTPTSKIAIIKTEPHDDSVERYGFNKSDGSNLNPVEVEIVANLLKQARSQVLNSVDADTKTKKLLDALIRTVIDEFYTLPEERDRVAQLVSVKTRIVFLCFLLWILVVAMILLFGSAFRSASTGLLPT